MTLNHPVEGMYRIVVGYRRWRWAPRWVPGCTIWEEWSKDTTWKEAELFGKRIAQYNNVFYVGVFYEDGSEL